MKRNSDTSIVDLDTQTNPQKKRFIVDNIYYNFNNFLYKQDILRIIVDMLYNDSVFPLMFTCKYFFIEMIKHKQFWIKKNDQLIAEELKKYNPTNYQEMIANQTYFYRDGNSKHTFYRKFIDFPENYNMVLVKHQKIYYIDKEKGYTNYYSNRAMVDLSYCCVLDDIYLFCSIDEQKHIESIELRTLYGLFIVSKSKLGKKITNIIITSPIDTLPLPINNYAMLSGLYLTNVCSFNLDCLNHFENLINLKMLEIVNCGLNHENNCLEKSKLFNDKVHICYQKLSLTDDQFPNIIFQMKNLMVLKLSGFKFSKPILFTAELSNLQILDLSFNEMKFFPECLYLAPNLLKLDLSHNEIKFFPQCLYLIPNLLKIDLSHNIIERIDLSQYPNPRTIFHLFDNPINDLCNTNLSYKKCQIAGIKVDETLQISFPLAVVPKKLVDKRKYKSVVFQNIVASLLDSNTFNNRKISQVYISNTRLISLPDFNNCKIVHLSISNNLITKFPVFHNCNISKINMNNNLSESLDNNFQNISNLKSLLITHHRIKNLDSGFFNFATLTNLNLSNNQLTILPNVINMPCLKKLNLSNNLIQIVPKSILSIPNLHMLDLSDNQINNLSLDEENSSKLVADKINIKIKNNLIKVINCCNSLFSRIKFQTDHNVKVININ